ncbi:unnamed protein product [Calicophoron daubneyi]|uniref:Uncharacterized protein n=1 Tax=Calicophoron daubneyi TaxID=300641 RepID=A0AAV2U0H9_CALDB
MKMPGDIGRIPIISLSGCKYLTDILSELPIPQSTYVSIGSRTLLHEPKLVHDAYRCINGEDEKLVDCLASALRHICTDNIIFRDKISELSADNPRIPTLYKAIIKKNEVLSSRQTKPKEDPDVVSRGCTSAGHSEKHLPPEALDVSGGSCTKADREELDSSNDPHPDTRPAPKPVYSAIPVAPLKIALKKTVCDAQSHKKADKHKKHKKCKAVPSQPTTLLLESPEKTCISSPKVELSDSSQKLEKVIELNPVSLPEKSAEPSEKDSLRNTPVFPANSLPPLLPSSDVSLLPSVSSQVSTCPPSSCTVSVSETMVSEHVPAALPDEPAQLPVVQSPHLVTDSSSEPLPCISTLSIASTTSQTPATTVSNPVTPVNDTSVVSSRRIPDPALSQLFHSAALFHAYQPHCETHKQGESTGGGLFDDWLNNSVKSSDPSGLGSTSVPLSTDCAYSGSASGPSSVVGLTSNISQAPHSVGAILDASGFPSRSPQSVPSSHSSYPATPGGAVVIIPSQTLSSFTTVVASPSGISRCVHAPSAVPSPSARLFDNIESRTETQESISADDQAHAAPHGLAAYLPRSNSLRSNFASVHDVMSEQGVSACSKDLSAVSPNSSTVPCTYSPGSHSQSQSDPNIRPGSTIKPGNKHTNIHGTHSYEPHESKSPRGKLRGRGGRFTAGKGRGGGRRRRTELEDLKMWSMNDSCNAPSDRKLGDAAECFPPSSLKVPSSGSPSLKRSSEARTNGEDVDECANKPFTGLIDEVGSDHGGFTEALVERVKRRHQQREMEPRTSQPYQRCPSTHRSSDASPASSVSPMRSKTAQVSERADGFTNHRVLNERAHKKHNTEAHLKSKVQDASLSASSDKNVDRFKCSDSDSSLSPISTVASSVRSSKLDDSLSSCPNSAAPPAPAPETKVGNELCSSMDSLSPSNLSPDHVHLRSSHDHSKSRVDEGGNTNRSHTLHSSPTLFNSSSTQKNRSSVSGILDEVPNSAYGDAQFDNWDAQSSKNEDNTKRIRRRRRITIHDEDAEDGSTKDKNLGNRFGSLLPPRLEEVRTDPGVLSTKPAEYASNSPLPPTLLPLTSASSDRWERHKKPLHSPVSSHSRIETLWEKQSESDVSTHSIWVFGSFSVGSHAL